MDTMMRKRAVKKITDDPRAHCGCPPDIPIMMALSRSELDGVDRSSSDHFYGYLRNFLRGRALIWGSGIDAQKINDLLRRICLGHR